MNIDSDHQLDKSQLSRLLSVIQSVPTHVAIISLAPPPHHSTQTYKILFRTLLVIKPTKCSNFSNLFLEWNSARFGQFLCPSSGVFHCTHSNGICYTDLLTAASSCQQICITYTIAVCTVKNSWWWTEELSETCRVSLQEWIWEIRASSWFYYKKFNMLYGHMNVKFVHYVA